MIENFYGAIEYGSMFIGLSIAIMIVLLGTIIWKYTNSRSFINRAYDTYEFRLLTDLAKNKGFDLDEEMRWYTIKEQEWFYLENKGRRTIKRMIKDKLETEMFSDMKNEKKGE